MLMRIIAAALADEPLGAPSVIAISGATSTGNNGEYAGIVFKSNGYHARYFSGVAIDVNNWITPQVNMGEYELRATLMSGDTPGGDFDVWQPLSSTLTYKLRTLTPDETLTSSVLIEIRWTGNNVVQDSATYGIVANGPPS